MAPNSLRMFGSNKIKKRKETCVKNKQKNKLKTYGTK